MELQLIENKDGSKQTRIKVSHKELRTDRVLWLMIEEFKKRGGLILEKESSRYKYFIADGDLLNERGEK